MSSNEKYYDPSHPDADWSGFVPPLTFKKHVQTTPTQITSLSTGIGPTDDATTNEWKPGRKPGSFSKEGSASPNNPSASSSSTFTLIGGPIPEIDPSVVQSSHWQSEAQAASARTETTVEQMTEMGRAMHIRGKKSTVPAYENVRPFDESVAARMRGENPYSLNEVSMKEFQGKQENLDIHAGLGNKENLIGYRSHRGGAARSFLEGLGKELAASIPPSKHVISPAPYATDGELPTDPYATEDGGRRKDLLLENYSGKRTY